MKYEKVLERVYEPGRLWTAWQQVKENAGAAGIDKMTQRVMIKAGFKHREAHRVWIKMNKWQLVNRKEVRFVMNLDWFRRQGLIFLYDFTQKTFEPRFSR